MTTTGKDKKRILVIDDEEILTKTFSRLLEKTGYEVYIAKNGTDALAMAEEESFDLIICDIRMPGLDGVETLKAIRADSGHTNGKIPVIFITGFADEQTEANASALKPFAYLYKPFDVSELLELVKRALIYEPNH